MKRGFLNTHRDSRGVLTSFELSKLPYSVKRIFWVTDVPENEIRGKHAHKETWQTLICVKGGIHIEAKGSPERLKMTMTEGEYLVLPPMTWVSLMFESPESVLLVACSHPYNADDYINNYDEFINYKKS